MTIKITVISVEYMDGHRNDYRRIIFTGLKPYSNLQLFSSEKTLIIVYDEGEGDIKQVVLNPESYPFKPMGETHEIVFILNGERNYSVEYQFSME